jgi:hypothetical protein
MCKCRLARAVRTGLPPTVVGLSADLRLENAFLMSLLLFAKFTNLKQIGQERPITRMGAAHLVRWLAHRAS